jgi:hypothetical protein
MKSIVSRIAPIFFSLLFSGYFDILKEQKLTQNAKKIIEKWKLAEEVVIFKTIPKEELIVFSSRNGSGANCSDTKSLNSQKSKSN